MHTRRIGGFTLAAALAVAVAMPGSARALEDPPPRLVRVSVAPIVLVERDLYQRTDSAFVATITEAVDHDVVFRATTRNETARARSDFDFFTRRVVIPAGDTSVEIPVRVLGDYEPEGTETFRLELTDPGPSVVFSTLTVQAEIIDNDENPPTVSVGDLVVTERGLEVGQGSVGKVTFAWSAAITAPVTVTWRTVDGSAIDGEHYIGASGSFTVRPTGTFPPRRSIRVQLSPNDIVPEPDRDFTVEIVDVSGPGLVGDATATVTVRDDDHLPTVSLGDDVDVVEGDDGTTRVIVRVLLDRPSERRVRVMVGSRDGTAVGGQLLQADRDYVNVRNLKVNQPVQLVFRPGRVDGGLGVLITGDTQVEGDEFLTVYVGEVSNATPPTRSEATITIIDDD